MALEFGGRGRRKVSLVKAFSTRKRKAQRKNLRRGGKRDAHYLVAEGEERKERVWVPILGGSANKKKKGKRFLFPPE